MSEPVIRVRDQRFNATTVAIESPTVSYIFQLPAMTGFLMVSEVYLGCSAEYSKPYTTTVRAFQSLVSSTKRVYVSSAL